MPCPKCNARRLFTEQLAASGTEPAHREIYCLCCGWRPTGPVLPLIDDRQVPSHQYVRQLGRQRDRSPRHRGQGLT